jgi:hypothetical protein
MPIPIDIHRHELIAPSVRKAVDSTFMFLKGKLMLELDRLSDLTLILLELRARIRTTPRIINGGGDEF